MDLRWWACGRRSPGSSSPCCVVDYRLRAARRGDHVPARRGLERRLDGARRRLRRAALGLAGPRLAGEYLAGLPDREVALGRQPVRLRADLRLLRACRPPSSAGCSSGASSARSSCAAVFIPPAPRSSTRSTTRSTCSARSWSSRGSGWRALGGRDPPGAKPGAQAARPRASADDRLPRRPPVRHGERPAASRRRCSRRSCWWRRSTSSSRSTRSRRSSPSRDETVHRLRGQRVLAARAGGALLRPGRDDGPLPLPEPRPRRGPRLRRREDGALRPLQDPGLRLARRHRRHARGRGRRVPLAPPTPTATSPTKHRRGHARNRPRIRRPNPRPATPRLILYEGGR